MSVEFIHCENHCICIDNRLRICESKHNNNFRINSLVDFNTFVCSTYFAFLSSSKTSSKDRKILIGLLRFRYRMPEGSYRGEDWISGLGRWLKEARGHWVSRQCVRRNIGIWYWKDNSGIEECIWGAGFGSFISFYLPRYLRRDLQFSPSRLVEVCDGVEIFHIFVYVFI